MLRGVLELDLGWPRLWQPWIGCQGSATLGRAGWVRPQPPIGFGSAARCQERQGRDREGP
eukprot:scaffold39856_cov64-Phaeocystis_antarctica.AAC.7